MSRKAKIFDDNSIISNKKRKQKFYEKSHDLNKMINDQKTYTFSYTKDKTIILASVFNKDYFNDGYGDAYVDFSTVFIEVDPQSVTYINNKYLILLRSTDNKSKDYFEVTKYNNKYFIELNFVNSSDELYDFNNTTLKLLLSKCNADIEFIPYYYSGTKKYNFIVLLAKFYI